MSELVNGFDGSIADQKASKVGPAGIDIAYQRLGNPDAPVVLLIWGSQRNPFIGRTRFAMPSSIAACRLSASTIVTAGSLHT
jgi:hypothetical protein